MLSLRGKNLCNPEKFMRHKKTPTNKVTHPGLLALKNGVVWVGAPEPNYKTDIAVKKCKKHEFDTQKALHKEFPNFVPDVYDGVQCDDGFFMYSEYVKGGSLKSYKNDPNLEKYVYKILVDLKILHEKHPSFRHNDLHVDNVLMRGKTPLVYDFEFANWHGNPLFDAVFKKDYGIYSGNHPMYDVHFFINSVCAEFSSKFKTKALSVFPPEYIMSDSPVVKNWRLRYDVSHKNLPTMDDVIRVFSPTGNKMKPPRVLTFTNTKEKKTRVNRSPPTRRAVTGLGKTTARNRERIRNMKAEILRKNNTMNNVTAELKAIRNYNTLKLAGLITPSPSPLKTRPAGRSKKTSPRPRPRVVVNVPVVTFTETPRKRARIGSKLCSSYKKTELVNMMKRLGHRVDSKMRISNMCKMLSSPPKKRELVKMTKWSNMNYKRPAGAPTVDVRKKTYETYLKKNLYKLAKNVGIKVTLKAKKDELVNKIRSKLNKNISNALKGMNVSKVTARQLAEKLARNYKWANNRHVERTRLLKIYSNNV